MVALLPLSSPRVADRTTAQSRTPAHTIIPRPAGWWIGRSSLLGLALIGITGLGGCAAEVDENTDVATNVTVSSETRIFGGEIDDDQEAVSSVVALKVGTAGSYELCSGVLVAPNVVLTARHCVATSITTSVSCDEKGNSTNGSHVSGDLPASAVAVYTGATPKFSEQPDAVGTAIVAPSSDILCDSDIALVVLDEAIPGVEPVAVRLGVGVSPGETIRSVGYGQNDQKKPLGTRLRKPGVAVLAMGSGVSASRTALGPHEFEVGRSICQGDSGGPAISEDTGAVVGVVSRGGDCEENFGHIYTTTAGWRQLFDAAFAVAGGAPVLESGRPAGTHGSTPRTKPVHSPLAEEDVRAESCSVSHAPARGGASAASVLVLVGCAVVLRCRRRASSASARG